MNPSVLATVTASLFLSSLVSPLSVYAQPLETSSPITDTAQTTNPKSQLESVVQPQACLPVWWWFWVCR